MFNLLQGSHVQSGVGFNSIHCTLFLKWVAAVVRTQLYSEMEQLSLLVVMTFELKFELKYCEFAVCELR